METQKKVELDSPVALGPFSVVPVSLTVVITQPSPHGAVGMVVREALGVIIPSGRGARALMCDGRELTLEQLAAEYPGLAGELAAFHIST